MGDEARSADGAVTTSRDGTVLHIALDRTSHRNALSHSMIDTLTSTLAAAALFNTTAAPGEKIASALTVNVVATFKLAAADLIPLPESVRLP